ncbi:uncharacterized protein [Parasteatoda tepidariorum]|uniref:uncharacterized protein n=1 Tax=Parasteatoda tepidariorum TaxID=114398 RepID=UPI0039BD8869
MVVIYRYVYYFREEEYLTTKDSVKTNRKGFCGKHTNNMMDEKMKHLISVTINLNNMQTMTYNYIPKYESIEISSNLAGYIGIWLGVSFIYVINLLEEMFSSLMNSFKKLLKRQTNSQSNIVLVL